MRKEKETGLFRRIGASFTRNFGLKLLSLALAILIYVVLRPEANPRAQTSVLPMPAVLPGPAAAEPEARPERRPEPQAVPVRHETQPEEAPKPPVRKDQAQTQTQAQAQVQAQAQAQATGAGAKKTPVSPNRPKSKK